MDANEDLLATKRGVKRKLEVIRCPWCVWHDTNFRKRLARITQMFYYKPKVWQDSRITSLVDIKTKIIFHCSREGNESPQRLEFKPNQKLGCFIWNSKTQRSFGRKITSHNTIQFETTSWNELFRAIFCSDFYCFVHNVDQWLDSNWKKRADRSVQFKFTK